MFFLLGVLAKTKLSTVHPPNITDAVGDGMCSIFTLAASGIQTRMHCMLSGPAAKTPEAGQAQLRLGGNSRHACWRTFCACFSDGARRYMVPTKSDCAGVKLPTGVCYSRCSMSDIDHHLVKSNCKWAFRSAGAGGI